MPDQPRLFRDQNEISLREAEIDSPHVAPLNAWVRTLRNRLGLNAIVPWFDPQDGGCEARILWLLEAPGPKATRERGGSGFISCNNNDGTALNTWETREEAGVSRKLVVHWNVIPYYIGTDTKIRAYNPNDIAAVGPFILELISLLPRLKVVILGGEAARKVWQDFSPSHKKLHAIECPHPSPTNLNTRPGNRDQVIDAWREALKYIRG
ncbi:MAG: uracil-DNA glycosylase [Anaerolineaceae bacterium]|nr:uracil-DNA glycosylase [Anaerolineaceae bacterium]